MIVLIPYINLSNLSWIIKCLFLRNMAPLIIFLRETCVTEWLLFDYLHYIFLWEPWFTEWLLSVLYFSVRATSYWMAAIGTTFFYESHELLNGYYLHYIFLQEPWVMNGYYLHYIFLWEPWVTEWLLFALYFSARAMSHEWLLFALYFSVSAMSYWMATICTMFFCECHELLNG